MTAPGAAPRRWLFVLHGIFGAGRNWRSVTRRVVEARPDWGALLLDLRLHGASEGFAPPHTVREAAIDVRLTAVRIDIRADAVLGHSFGGKVALAFLEAQSEAGADPPRQVWIIDSTPAAEPAGASARRVLRLLRSIPGPFASRRQAIEHLQGTGLNAATATWMATNLEQTGDGLRWKLDLDGVEQLLDSFFRADLWGIVEHPPTGTEIHFVKAEDGLILGTEVCRRIEAAADGGRVWLHRVKGGHWLNVDNPDALVDLLSESLP